MAHPLLYTYTGLLHKAWLHATHRRMVVAGACRMCGWCCTRLNLSYQNRWIRSENAFERLKQEYPDYRRFTVIGRTLSGLLLFHCTMLNEDNLCSDHENRPEYCSQFPHPDLIFLGGGLKPDCGFRFETVPDFQRMLRQETRRPQAPGKPGAVIRRGL